MAFLLNQMNVGAFKINTVEKLDIGSSVKLSQTNSGNDFSKELRAAVDEKRKFEKTDTTSLKKFEKKLSKVNHDAKEKANTMNKDKVSGKKNEESQPAKKVESGKADDKLQTNKQDENLGATEKSENQKTESIKNEDVNGKGAEETKAVAEVDGADKTTQTESVDANVSQVNGDLSKIAEQLVSLMQELQKNGTSEVAPTQEELTKATELLDKINSGKIETAEALKELGKLVDTIKTKGTGVAEGSAVKSDFQKLVELTGDKLKVIKNELADAKEQMNKIAAKSDNLGNVSQRKNEALGVKTETMDATEQVIQTDEKASVKETKPQAETKQAEEDVTKSTEGAETIGALQTKKSVLTQDEKISKTAIEDNADAKVAEKTEALKTDTKTNNGNSEKESLKNGNNAKMTEGNLKTDKNSDSVSFQTVAQNTVKESERPTEAPKLNRTPVIDRTEVLSQIVKKADLLVGKTQSEMIMKLEPENLGKVSLKIAMERGTMTATFQAENQQIKALIESNTDSLRDMLQEKGINVSAINVSVNQQSGDNQNWQNQNQGQFNGNMFGKKESIGNRGNSMIGQYGIVGMTDAVNSKKNPYTKHEGSLDIKG